MNAFKSLVVAVVFSTAAIQSTRSQNLLVNPSFESPYIETFPNYVDLPGGSTYLPGWTTILDGVEVFTANDIGAPFPWPTTVSDGKQAVDLPPFTRLGGGGIQQSFATIPGLEYQVTFDLGTAKSFERDGTGTVQISVDAITQSHQVSNSSADWAWSQYGFTFVADDTSATLRFQSFDNPFTHFASVDNVSVQPAPDSASSASLLVIGMLGVFGACQCVRRKPAQVKDLDQEWTTLSSINS